MHTQKNKNAAPFLIFSPTSPLYVRSSPAVVDTYGKKKSTLAACREGGGGASSQHVWEEAFTIRRDRSWWAYYCQHKSQKRDLHYKRNHRRHRESRIISIKPRSKFRTQTEWDWWMYGGEGDEGALGGYKTQCQITDETTQKQKQQVKKTI